MRISPVIIAPMLDKQRKSPEADMEVSNIVKGGDPTVLDQVAAIGTGMSKDSKKTVVYETRKPNDYCTK